METTVQEKFDALVAEFGAEAVIAAVKGHSVKSADPTGCTVTGCPPHYICNTSTGNCVLDLG